MNYYLGEINTPFEKYVVIYIAETDHQSAEWKVWDEAKLYGQRILAEMEDPEIDEREFIDACEGHIICQVSDNHYTEASRDGWWCV